MKPYMFFSQSRQQWLCYTRNPLRGAWAQSAEAAYRTWKLMFDERRECWAE